MKLKLLAVGTKMPDWVETGIQEYSKRLPQDYQFQVTEIPLAQRGKKQSGRLIELAMAKEGEAMLAALDKNDYPIALDVKGKVLSTEQLASQLSKIRDQGLNLTLLVGGPDGLSPDCLNKAKQCWSLSALTLPHPIVRVIVAEQLYRAWSVLNNHPYHRAG